MINDTQSVPQRGGFLKAFFGSFLGAFFAGCASLIFSGLILVIVLVAFGGGGEKTQKFGEKIIKVGSDGSRIAVINAVGEISTGSESDGVAGQTVTSGRLIAELEQAAIDDTVKAIILKVDSPGGGVVASAEINKKVAAVNATKKIYVSMGDVAASGGYYISAPAHKIYANRDTLTGSIGVIMEIPNASGLLDKIGVSFNTIKSGKHKDIGSPYRALSKEEQQILQTIIDQAFVGFKDVVKSGRKLTDVDLVGFEDGRVLTGEQAKALKLVDELGNLEDVISAVKSENSLSEAQVFEFAGPSFLESLTGAKQNAIKLFSGAPQLKPRLLYLWQPGL